MSNSLDFEQVGDGAGGLAARPVGTDRRRRRAIPEQLDTRVSSATTVARRPVMVIPPPGPRSRSGERWSSELRKPVFQKMTSTSSAVSAVPSDPVPPQSQHTPVSVIRVNIGRQVRMPSRRAASIAGVRANPVTETTDVGGSPARTRSSTRATAARPFSAVNGVGSNDGSRREHQNVCTPGAFRAISISSWTAEMPAPTTRTRLPANSAGPV
nr:hypothetical protein ISGA_11680 [Gordonia sp. NB41Y]